MCQQICTFNSIPNGGSHVLVHMIVKKNLSNICAKQNTLHLMDQYTRIDNFFRTSLKIMENEDLSNFKVNAIKNTHILVGFECGTLTGHLKLI
jgi:hypothetical protein